MGLQLKLSSRRNVGETNAKISYIADFNISGVTFTRYVLTIQLLNGTIVYSDTVYSTSGTIKVIYLSKGAENIMTAKMTGYYTYTTTDELGNLITKTGNTTISTNTNLYIYTHPGSFSMGATQDSFIHKTMTKDKIDEWVKHFSKVYHWYNQNDEDYSKISDLQVTSGDPITAEWFNACMRAMNFVGKDYSYVTGGPNGTIITAEIINQLNFSGTGNVQ